MVTVSGLFVSPAKGSGLSTPVERARAIAAHGFEGCGHAGRERREVLFASGEHLDAVGVEPGAIRENIIVAGTDVQAWEIGQRVRVGSAVFEITMVCEPCHKMDALREGLRSELDGKRGMLAIVVEGGDVGVGDELSLL